MRVDANRLRNATPFLGTENKKEGKVVTLQKLFMKSCPDTAYCTTKWEVLQRQ